jgi:hypothetical protein
MTEKQIKDIEDIKEKNFSLWLRERTIVEEDFSNYQGTFCTCGKLATGLHERTCRKFNQKVDAKTLKVIRKLTI